MVKNTIQLMLMVTMTMAASDINYAQELLLLPGKENLTNLPNSSLSLLATQSFKPKNLKVECSPQFIANVKIAAPFADICSNQGSNSGLIKDLVPTIGSLKMTPVGSSLSGSFIRFVFSDVEKSEPDISLVYSFKIPLVIPLVLSSSEVEIFTGNEPKGEQKIAEVMPSYLINANSSDFILEAEPKELIVGHSFENTKLFLEFNTSALKEATAVSFQLIDPSNGLRSSKQVLKVTPVALKLKRAAISLTSQMAIMISVISFATVMIIAILAIFSIYSKDVQIAENQNLETVTDQPTRDYVPSNPQQGEEKVLTESILIWNQNVMDKHKSRSLSTLETSNITGHDSPSSDRVVYFGKFDISDEIGCYGIEEGDQDIPDNVSLSVLDKCSVMTQPENRRSAFL